MARRDCRHLHTVHSRSRSRRTWHRHAIPVRWVASVIVSHAGNGAYVLSSKVIRIIECTTLEEEDIVRAWIEGRIIKRERDEAAESRWK